jgi:hypothetical protein
MLTEQAETFITGHYQSGYTGDYPTAHYQPAEQRTGEYRQYRDDAPPTAGYPAMGGHSAYGGQDSRPAAGQPARAIGGPAGTGSTTPGWPAQYDGQQYDGQRHNGQRHNGQRQQPLPQAQSRQPASLAAAPLSAPVPADNGPATMSSPAVQPAGGAPAKGGLNPYDVAITGSYPYAGQALPAALPGPTQSGPAQSGSSQSGPSQSGPAQAGGDDPYYRPLTPDGYSSGRGDQGRGTPARAGYGEGYGNGYQDHRDRRY